MRRYGLLALPLLLVVVIGFVGVTTAGSGGGDTADDGGPAAAGDGAVDIAMFQFGPVDVTVAAGTPITWTNQDGSPHSIQDDSGEELFPESEDLGQGDTFSFTYADPGTYAYICGIHNYMQGSVTVSSG